MSDGQKHHPNVVKQESLSVEGQLHACLDGSSPDLREGGSYPMIQWHWTDGQTQLKTVVELPVCWNLNIFGGGGFFLWWLSDVKMLV